MAADSAWRRPWHVRSPLYLLSSWETLMTAHKVWAKRVQTTAIDYNAATTTIEAIDSRTTLLGQQRCLIYHFGTSPFWPWQNIQVRTITKILLKLMEIRYLTRLKQTKVLIYCLIIVSILAQMNFMIHKNLWVIFRLRAASGQPHKHITFASFYLICKIWFIKIRTIHKM